MSLYPSRSSAPSSSNRDLWSHPLFTFSPTSFGDLERSTPRPAIDVHEKGEKYHVEAEVAGANKSDLKIEFGGDGGEVLTISGKVERTNRFTDTPSSNEGDKKASTKSHSTWSTERFYGNFARSIRFPTPVDVDSVTAKYDNGILEIEVPKKQKEGKKSITIT